MKAKYKRLLAPLVLALLAAGCNSSSSHKSAQVEVGTHASVALLETTDLHTNILGYDYFKLAEDKSLGLDRTISLIQAARAEFSNTLLFDNGDTIQGSALADYQALIAPIDCSTTLAQYKVMNRLNYDAGVIGNHEFNYGLAFLSQVTGTPFNVEEEGLPSEACAGPNFPLVLANVVSSKDDQPLFAPYVILDRTLQAEGPDGSTVEAPIKVGVIGFAPPPILNWDKRWLDGKVYVTDTIDTAAEYVTQMRAEGADLVVMLEHGGVDSSPYSASMENAGYYLAQVRGVDVLFLGHSHQTFPNATSTATGFNAEGVDKTGGFIHGVPATMGGYWGKNLGVVKLELVYGDSGWYVDTPQTTVEVRATLLGKDDQGANVYVTPDTSVAELIASEHAATIAYVKTPIGDTDFRMTTYFADVGEVTAVEIVNQAQAAYVADYVAANLPQYQGLPVLSVSAPFKSGYGGGSDYTDVAQGDLAINNAADLYLYPNTVYAVKVTGQGIKDWLEKAANRFNQIDPTLTTAQELVSSFPGYNFDLFTTADISYQIDVTQPAGSRIVSLTYQGSPIDLNGEFIIATNNYRASGGGSFPGLDGSNIIYASPDANRDVLISYIKQVQHLTRSQHGAHRSWRFAPVTTAGPVIFHSAQGQLEVANAAGLNNVSLYQADDGSAKGLSIYQIDLSQ